MHRIILKGCLAFFVGLLFTQSTYSQVANTGSSVAAGAYFTSFDSTRIYHEVRGEGPAVVLLHGFTNTLESWKNKPLYQALLEKGFKVVVLDLRGNGKSDTPASVAGYERDAEAKDVMGLLLSLGIDSYQVVGYSRGSIIAARLLVLDNRINSAVLGGMGEAFTNPNWPRRIAFYEALISENPHKDFEGFLAYVQKSGLNKEVLAMQQQAQPSTSPLELSRVKIPVLVISGNEDLDNGSAEALAKMLPNAKSKRVTGEHNTAHQSKEFAQEVVSFVQQAVKQKE